MNLLNKNLKIRISNENMLDCYIIDSDQTDYYALNLNVLSAKYCANKSDFLNAEGIIFFIGTKDLIERKFVYVDASKNMAKSVTEKKQFEEKNISWSKAICVKTKEASSISLETYKYLAYVMIEAILSYGVYDIENDFPIERPRYKPEMLMHRNDFMSFIRAISSVLNLDLIDVLLPNLRFMERESDGFADRTNDRRLGVFDGNKRIADLVVNDKGIHILKGSHINPEMSKDLHPIVVALREHYDRHYKYNNYVLSRSICLYNWSLVSSFVLGRNSDCNVDIVDRIGVNLGNLLTGYIDNRKPVFRVYNKYVNYTFDYMEIKCFGYFCDNNFILRKGSKVRIKPDGKCDPEILNRRWELKHYIDENGFTTQDIVFDSLEDASIFASLLILDFDEYWFDPSLQSVKAFKQVMREEELLDLQYSYDCVRKQKDYDKRRIIEKSIKDKYVL